MLFNSYAFLLAFLPICLTIFFSLARFRLVRMATIWLTLSSLAFYAYWSIAYLPLLCISILFNYQVGRSISDYSKQGSWIAKLLLSIGVGVNLILLAYYKYAGFFVESSNHFLDKNWIVPQIVLPLGISFYTFTQTAYLVDAYRGETKEYNLLTYSVFVTFFPHLIAGPILHHSDIIPQFHRLRNFIFSHTNMALGVTLFGLGLAKKVLIADSLLPWVGPVFNNASAVNFIEAWVGALGYTFQLYFDFSGYSDMAIGLGLMFNIHLPINFNSPYKSTSISDFWRRWHITLSNFLRDYLYIPLGGNRHGEMRRYTNLLTTMLLGGLWHGAGWTFVIWGGLHGLYLCINHGWTKLHISLPKLVAWFITLLAVVVGWVLFRANTLHDAIDILQAMFGMKGIMLPDVLAEEFPKLSQLGFQFANLEKLTYLPKTNGSKAITLAVLAGLVLCVSLLPNTQQLMQKFQPNQRWAIGIGILVTFCLLSLNRVTEFLYFQF